MRAEGRKKAVLVVNYCSGGEETINVLGLSCIKYSLQALAN